MWNRVESAGMPHSASSTETVAATRQPGPDQKPALNAGAIGQTRNSGSKPTAPRPFLQQPGEVRKRVYSHFDPATEPLMVLKCASLARQTSQEMKAQVDEANAVLDARISNQAMEQVHQATMHQLEYTTRLRRPRSTDSGASSLRRWWP